MRFMCLLILMWYFGNQITDIAREFSKAKIANDSSIAADTLRIAVALEAKK